MGYEISITDKAKEFIANKGYDQQFGARPLNRAIQKYLEDPVADEILKGDFKEGESIEADYNSEDDRIVINRLPGKKSGRKKSAPTS